MRVPKGYRALRIVSPVQQQTDMARMLSKRKKSRKRKMRKNISKRKRRVVKKRKTKRRKTSNRKKSIKGRRPLRKDIFS